MRSPVTEIPGHAANGALTWPRHRSSNQPDAAVKANDHEWLVAMAVYVLPCSCSNGGGRRRVGMLVWTGRRIPATLGLCGDNPSRAARASTTGVLSLQREASWCNLLWRMRIPRPATLGRTPGAVPVVGAAPAMGSERF
jgi:hypothetical protein